LCRPLLKARQHERLLRQLLIHRLHASRCCTALRSPHRLPHGAAQAGHAREKAAAEAQEWAGERTRPAQNGRPGRALGYGMAKQDVVNRASERAATGAARHRADRVAQGAATNGAAGRADCLGRVLHRRPSERARNLSTPCRSQALHQLIPEPLCRGVRPLEEAGLCGRSRSRLLGRQRVLNLPACQLLLDQLLGARHATVPATC
jgi:hypothetical protein